MELWDLMYLLNVFCVWFSWNAAMNCFEDERKFCGYFNLVASASNAAIVLDHIV